MSDNKTTNDLLEGLANELYEAEVNRYSVEPITDRYPELTIEDAYRIQQLNVERRLAAGEKVIGHKIGLTARAMQIKFGVDVPDYGHLLDSMQLDGKSPMDMSEFVDPQIEVEPAFVIGSDLSGPKVTPEDVLEATDYICVCFEIVDSRIRNWRIKLQDTVADNGSSAACDPGY